MHIHLSLKQAMLLQSLVYRNRAYLCGLPRKDAETERGIVESIREHDKIARRLQKKIDRYNASIPSISTKKGR